MGNILSSCHVFYVGYEFSRVSAHGSSNDTGDDTGDDKARAPYGSRRVFPELCRCPQGDGSQDRERWGGWGGKVVGIQRRKGCKTSDHWALNLRPDIDVLRLPRRIKGFRTKIPGRCKKTCGK
ncbi:hypothetical protein F5Y11DRAFT_352910 [Daldinia sp. FL1419]|nr:hypothetical protein F5Y11DRAFT_352910 [Daldinia sp. FL1419]